MSPSRFQQLQCLLVQGFRADWADKERLLTPVLFALSLLLLFHFAFDEAFKNREALMLTAEVALISLLSLQMSFVRIFSPDQQDKVFELLRSYPLSPSVWFLAKWLLSLAYSLTVFAAVMLCSSLFLAAESLSVWQWPLWLTGFLALAGLAALGVLLSVLTLQASGREMLFPLLYFPLAVPVLLCFVQANLMVLSPQQGLVNGEGPWLGLLTGFDVIYFTLGLVLFGELVAIS